MNMIVGLGMVHPGSGNQSISEDTDQDSPDILEEKKMRQTA